MYCPTCHQYNDPAISPSGRTPPKDWDPIMCVGCLTILTIDHTRPGSLRLPTVDDWTAWKADPRLAPYLDVHTQTRKEDPDEPVSR